MGWDFSDINALFEDEKGGLWERAKSHAFPYRWSPETPEAVILKSKRSGTLGVYDSRTGTMVDGWGLVDNYPPLIWPGPLTIEDWRL